MREGERKKAGKWEKKRVRKTMLLIEIKRRKQLVRKADEGK